MPEGDTIFRAARTLNKALAGNVYKSEMCFACGINPFRRVGTLSDEQLQRLAEIARKFMHGNVQGTAANQTFTYTGWRRTTGRSDPAARLWVYRRAGEPCRKCGERIVSHKQGWEARSTFWCPRCQPLVLASATVA